MYCSWESILIGEHSVVYGYDALAMPIKALHIKTSVEDFDELYMDTKLYHGPFLPHLTIITA